MGEVPRLHGLLGRLWPTLAMAVAMTIGPAPFLAQAADQTVLAEQMGFGPEDVREFVLNGIDGSWLDDPTKRRWRQEWSREIDALIAQLD